MSKTVPSVLYRRIVSVLSESLPLADSNWWSRLVLDRLTPQQQSIVASSKVTSLQGLDLACLLRVLDQNWHDIARHFSLASGVRNWVKEAQSVRNRWAHLPASGLLDEDVFRDLDTIERLSRALGATDDELTDVRSEKQICANRFIVPAARNTSPDQPSTARKTSLPSSTGFAAGSLVRLKANAMTKGAVVAHLPGTPESRYQVFHDGNVSTYYASQLEADAVTATRPTVSVENLHASLTALQLRHPSTAHLYSLFASRINFVPYQFRPVLKLIQSDRPRLLIADEVGVGKTIEAGLILKELQARRDIRNVLVICPKPLVAERKWMDELKRFDEQFQHLDGDTLRYCLEELHLDGVWPQKYSRAIVPYSLFDETLLMGKQQGQKRIRGLLDLDPPPIFDLVIVDEAHHIRNTDTFAYRNTRYFCDNAEAVVLLSATPIQMGDNDLFNLLHLLRPDVLPNRMAFDQMAEPNPHLNEAIAFAREASAGWSERARDAIQRALATPWGRGVLASDPRLESAYECLGVNVTNAESRIRFIRIVEELYTFGALINRTRRRDIGDFTTRKPETVAIEFTPQQASLHNDLISLIGRILEHRHGDKNVMFMLTTVRRQVASCVFGLAPLLQAMLNRQLSQIEISDVSDDEDSYVSDALAEFRVEVELLIDKAQMLDRRDPKLDAFLHIVREKQKRPNNKLLVFSFFRHTLSYLVDQLRNESIRIGVVHGDVPDTERRDLRHRFSLGRDNPNAIDVLLSSEVGCEGLDFQFCDALVNYDLPWNPMRVEQRIGRIDRYGQKSETVVIYNLITPGTVDAEIYERCLLRIGIFRRALGGSEEILGRLTREIHQIAENHKLSPPEQANRLQQLADNEIRIVHEQARLEEEQAKLFGLSPPKRDAELVKQAASFWLSPNRLANLVERYLEQIESTKSPRNFGSKPVTTLQLGQEIRNKLLTDFQRLNLSGGAAQPWLRWLKGSEPYITLTFDAATAVARNDVMFVTPTHPLSRQAALAIEPSCVLTSNVQVTTNSVPAGRYPYAIYRWRKLGLKEDFTFQPVCATSAIAPHMMDLLESAVTASTSQTITTEEEQALEQTHHRLWSDARAVHIAQQREVAHSRLASLKTTHSARLALLDEQRDLATDGRIQRMRESQIESAKRDFERRMDELNVAATQCDIFAEAVTFGVLLVEAKK